MRGYSDYKIGKEQQLVRRQFVLALLLIVLTTATGCFPVPADLFVPQTPSATLAPAQPRSLIHSTLPFREVWRRDVPHPGENGSFAVSSSEILLARPEVLYVVNYEPNAEDARWSWPILALDPQTGKQKWKTEPFGYIDSFTAAPSMLVVASTYGIKAYDAATGKEKWIANLPPPNHEGYTISFDDSVLNLIRTGHYLYTQIDPESGHVGNFQESDEVLTKIDSRYRYKWKPLDTLWLEDIREARCPAPGWLLCTG